MKNIPDDVFRRKLEHLQTPPPAGAWEKIEKGMRRKRMTPWLAIAASLLLVITASALILTRQKGSDPREIASSKLPETKTSPNESNKSTIIPSIENRSDTSVVDEPAPEAKAVPDVADAPRDIKHEPVAINAIHQAPVVSSEKEQEEAEAEIINDTVPAADDSIPTMMTSVPVEDAPVKIVLEADEVQARYLKRKNNDNATDDVAKASGLRKLLDKADQIQNQNPIGDLRQMKNEILALNFSGKKRDQHK
ncbi:MAG TPA: hypothetical protein VF191_04570 [Cyclobacteriaceae bacterium]